MATEQQRVDNMDFTTGNIFKKLVGFMIPILGALILQTMYGAVDIVVVGWFGTETSISAVSTGSSLINMIVFILCGLAMGVTVLMGRYIGEGNERRLGRVIGGAILTFLVIAAILTLLLLVGAPFLAGWMQAPADALSQTITYIRICGGGIVFIIGYNLISSIFRGIGNSKLPLLFVGIACAVNIVLDILFVAGFRMDVAGAALATVIAQAENSASFYFEEIGSGDVRRGKEVSGSGASHCVSGAFDTAFLPVPSVFCEWYGNHRGHSSGIFVRLWNCQ